jgi:hypothetical protein
MDRSEPLGELERLYRQAFAKYGPVALWNLAPVEHPTPGAALAITPALRTHGSVGRRRLAQAIDRLSRAAD